MGNVVINFDINRVKSTSEALKALRANVQFCGTDIKTIAITSCLPGDGKSTTSLGLSIALAQAGKKILLVDADLRKSVMLSRYTDSVNLAGFSEFLSGLATMEEARQHTQIGNLDVIFCGQCPANPTELLSSSAFKRFLDEEKNNYDYIIIDTPPLGLVVDAAVIASICNGVIMVLSEGKIKKGLALDVKKQLEKSGARIIGTVLNIQSKKKGTYGKYDGSYSGQYASKYGYKYSYE